MIYLPMILLSLFNGISITVSRILNAKLGTYVSSSGASVWNHLTGFLILIPILPFLNHPTPIDYAAIPFVLYIGGLIGSVYVLINNVVIPKIGATKSTMLLIAGQIVVGVMIDFKNGKISNLPINLFGVSLVLLGMWIKNSEPTIEEENK